MSSLHPTYPCYTIHIRFVWQSNVLVDKDGTARIAGLGNAIILPDPTEPVHSTAGCDVHAFGAMAWEVRMPLPTMFHLLILDRFSRGDRYPQMQPGEQSVRWCPGPSNHDLTTTRYRISSGG